MATQLQICNRKTTWQHKYNRVTQIQHGDTIGNKNKWAKEFKQKMSFEDEKIGQQNFKQKNVWGKTNLLDNFG